MSTYVRMCGLLRIEGFPIGEDEDILALSYPPYHTACPNPWLADMVAEWEKSKPKRLKKDYARETGEATAEEAGET